MNGKTTTTPDFDQHLAGILRPGQAPEDLRRSLIRAAQRHPSRSSWPALGIAAAITFLFGTGFLGWMAHRNSHEGERFARAALQEFMVAPRLDFTVDDSAGDSVEQCMERCRQWSIKAVGFSAPLPTRLADQPLKGGCACTVDSARAACYVLKDGRAVFVFDRPFKGLEADSKMRPVILASGHQASAWNENGRGYILAEPPIQPRF